MSAFFTFGGKPAASAAILENRPVPPAGIFKRYVAIGDSLTHGCLCLTVDEHRQRQTWPALLARQMKTTFEQPYLKFPGYMLNLEDVGKRNIRWYEYVYPLIGGVRVDNYRNQKRLNNFGITSATLDQVLSPPLKTKNVFFNNLLGTVLPYHRLVVGSSGRSAVDQALDRDPSFLSVWIGNNDTLIAAVIMMDIAVTPKPVFEEHWRILVDKILAEKSVKGVVMGNIPNLMDIALFEPLPDGSYKSVWQPDYDDVGEIMSREEATLITDHINYYNSLIEETALANGWAYADANCDFRAIKAAGAYELRRDEYITDRQGNRVRAGSGRVIGPEYLEGLFSLDGIHPSITGNAVAANCVIDAINRTYGTGLANIDEYEASEQDSLYRQPFDPRPWRNSWVFTIAYNVYKIIL